MARKSIQSVLQENIREPEAGQHVLLIGENIWGKGENVAAAYAQLRKANGRAIPSSAQVVAYHCHPESYVDAGGNIASPSIEDWPVKVAHVNKPVGKSRAHEVY